MPFCSKVLKPALAAVGTYSPRSRKLYFVAALVKIPQKAPYSISDLGGALALRRHHFSTHLRIEGTSAPLCFFPMSHRIETEEAGHSSY